ncbi:alpha/beta hydrolase [Mucilaginibacter sabulilitoris]|uniref:Alpha/beta hydrolase n=1 Tax=Mucilaginibacter sabulilitoris TaxID=1173583 RepID=A0ABZ0TED4_9SPHI|nr:alpha/beta hydrolase [Mucilaginibacter sabulilitoris]WPU91559.1 alpha/beta hydrolase [Mucilaginibacter sabulilitoris]
MKKVCIIISLNFFVLLVHAQIKFVKCDNGITIAYESFGRFNDPTVILINGTSAPMTDWPLAFCKKIAANGYNVIRFDNRDAGASSKLDALGQPDWAAIAPFVKTCKAAPLPYTLMDMARDVISLMKALNITKAHIAGASMGGAIAQLIAIHYPDKLLSLTCMSASSGNPNLPPPNAGALKAMTTPPQTTNRDTLANYLVHTYQALGSTDDLETLKKKAFDVADHSWYPAGAARQVAAVLVADNCDRRDDLAKIKVPAMIIHGDSDPLVSLQAGKEVAAAIPGAELTIVPGMGHDLSTKFIEVIVNALVKNADKVKR